MAWSSPSVKTISGSGPAASADQRRRVMRLRNGGLRSSCRLRWIAASARVFTAPRSRAEAASAQARKPLARLSSGSVPSTSSTPGWAR